METDIKMAAASLEADQIQSLFREKNVEKRKNLLAEFLKFPEFEEDDDLRSAILLDIYHDCLSFAVVQGLPWNHVKVFFTMIQNLLQYITCKSVPELIALFKQELQACSHFREASLQSLIDYVFTTFLQHFKLYRFVFTRDRSEDRTKYELTVEPPLQALCLAEGIPKVEWDEKERLREIDEMKEKHSKERHVHYQDLLDEAAKHLDIPFQELTVNEQPVNKETLTELVKNVASVQASLTETLLQATLDDMKDNLEYSQMRANVIAEYENPDKTTSNKKTGSSSSKSKRTKK